MFFKEAINTKAEEIRKFIPVSVATSFSNVSPMIGSAETKYIIPLLGQALYDQVHVYYTTPDSLPDGVTSDNKVKFDKLIEHIQRSLINLTYFSGFEFLSVSINDAGFHRQESDKEKSLYKYQEDAIKDQFKDAGFNGLDAMLEYIESHPDVFPNFKTSSAYTIRKASLIPSTKIYDDIIGIDSSRLIFLKLKRFIELAEDFEIKATLGKTLYDLIKAEIVKETPDAKILTLLPYIRKPLAHLAMSKAFVSLGFKVKDRGVFFQSKESSLVDSTKETPLNIQQNHALSKSEKQIGEFYLATLKDFLEANQQDYPTQLTDKGSPYTRDNSGKTTFWV